MEERGQRRRKKGNLDGGTKGRIQSRTTRGHMKGTQLCVNGTFKQEKQNERKNKIIPQFKITFPI